MKSRPLLWAPLVLLLSAAGVASAQPNVEARVQSLERPYGSLNGGWPIWRNISESKVRRLSPSHLIG
jgi:hypothetical protein